MQNCILLFVKKRIIIVERGLLAYSQEHVKIIQSRYNHASNVNKFT